MRIGVAREIKTDEYRVALTPAGALELIRRGHDVLIEEGAGVGSAFADAAYERVDARIVSTDEVWTESELLLKVKEPIEGEYARLREGLVLFTYLHIAADEPLTNATLPYVEAIADHGLREAVASDPALALGVNVVDGKITYEAVAEAHNLEYTPLEDVLPLSPV